MKYKDYLDSLKVTKYDLAHLCVSDGVDHLLQTMRFEQLGLTSIKIFIGVKSFTCMHPNLGSTFNWDSLENPTCAVYIWVSYDGIKHIKIYPDSKLPHDCGAVTDDKNEILALVKFST